MARILIVDDDATNRKLFNVHLVSPPLPFDPEEHSG
jgi:hypothetical protein